MIKLRYLSVFFCTMTLTVLVSKVHAQVYTATLPDGMSAYNIQLGETTSKTDQKIHPRLGLVGDSAVTAAFYEIKMNY